MQNKLKEFIIGDQKKTGILGHGTIDIGGLIHSIVTLDTHEYRAQSVGAIATNTYGDVKLYHLNVLTTKVVKAYNVGANIPALKNLVLRINNYRANAYEEC